MRWTVTWQPKAATDLAQIWLDAENRQAVADASNRIDRVLRISPDSAGQDFFGDRLYVDPPLAIVYTLHPDDYRVDVILVWARKT
jgi:hypothetical protein